MVAAVTASPAATTPQQAPPKAAPSFFHRLLSELNPLQYLPVIGTIYRAATGDVIPEQARFAGSLVVSFLTSGPIGLAINLGTTAIEHLTGVDPEAIGTHLLADIGIGSTPAAAAYAKNDTKPAQPIQISAAPAPISANTEKPWSSAQLTAYGVVQNANGTLTRGAISGADVLNGLELSRLGHAEGGALLAAVA
jgi:hypothetical protein